MNMHLFGKNLLSSPRWLESQSMKLQWILILLLTFLLGFDESQRYLQLDGSFNARSEANFASNSNVSYILPRGTRAEVLERQRFPSGNYGIKIRVESGPRNGRETWIYYNARDREATPMSLYRERPSAWGSAQTLNPTPTQDPAEAQAVQTQAPTPARPQAPLPVPPAHVPPPAQTTTEGGAGTNCANGRCAPQGGTAAHQLTQAARPILQAIRPTPAQAQPAAPQTQNVVSSSGFIHPLPGASITSRFGRRFRGQNTRVTEFHSGVDFQLGFQSPVRATKAGRVIRSVNHCGRRSTGCGSGYGNHIIVDHLDGTYSLYAHLDRDCSPLRGAGHQLQQGQVLGCVGNSGSVRGRTGVHLHFEIRRGSPGTSNYFALPALNPLEYIGRGGR